MFQYKMFVLKEWLQFIKHKKLLLLIGSVMLWMPFINYFAQNPLLPIEFILPVFTIFCAMVSTDLSTTVMREEFENKSYDIILVSQLYKLIFVISKLTIPFLSSLIILIVSISINDAIAQLSNQEILSHFATPSFCIFAILSLLCSHLAQVLMCCKHKSEFTRERGTIFAGINFLILMGLYFLNSIGFQFAVTVVLILIVVLILRAILIELQSDYHVIKKTKINKIKFNPQYTFFLIMCKESYIHVWDAKKTVCLVGTLLLGLGFTEKFQPLFEVELFVKLLFSVVYLATANMIIYSSTLVEKKMSGFLHMKLAKINSFKVIVSRILYPVTLNLMLTLLLQFFVFKSLSLGLHLLTLNIFNCLIILCFSLMVQDIKYEKIYSLFMTILAVLINLVLINFGFSIIVMLSINLIIFSICAGVYKKVYDKKSYK